MYAGHTSIDLKKRRRVTRRWVEIVSPMLRESAAQQRNIVSSLSRTSDLRLLRLRRSRKLVDPRGNWQGTILYRTPSITRAASSVPYNRNHIKSIHSEL